MRSRRAAVRTTGSVPLRTGLVVALVLSQLAPALAGPAPAQAASGTAISERLNAELAASGIPGGAVVVVEDGRATQTVVAGTSAGDAPMTASTPVVVGSVGKSLTALAVQQLAAAGRIDLDQPIRRYLPWLRLDAPDGAIEAITPRTLLSHRSGLSTADGQDPRWYEPGLTAEAVVRSLDRVRPDREVGSYEYSNLNYTLLGVLIEAVSGQPYCAYLAEHVFTPLEMGKSGCGIGDPSTERRTTGHRFLFGVAVPYDEPYASGIVPAGFQVSTAEDLARFAAALAEGGRWNGRDILAGAPAGAGAGPQLSTDWLPFTGGPGGSASQSGSTLTTNADILVVPSRRLAVAVVLNANPTQLLGMPRGAAELALDVLRLHDGQAPVAGPPSVRTVYLAVDVVLAVLAAVLLLHVARARTWVRRWRARRRPWLAVRTAALDGALPVAVLLGVPLLIGATGSTHAGDVVGGWRFVLWTLPDVGIALLVLAAAPLLLGVGKLLALRATRRPGLPAGAEPAA